MKPDAHTSVTEYYLHLWLLRTWLITRNREFPLERGACKFLQQYLIIFVFTHHWKHAVYLLQIPTTYICDVVPPSLLAQKAYLPPVGQGSLIIDASWLHSGTPHLVWSLWTRDHPDAETSTWQQTTLTTDVRSCPSRHADARTHNPRKRTAANPHLRRRGQWNLVVTQSISS
jgi:hypothetical protein